MPRFQEQDVAAAAEAEDEDVEVDEEVEEEVVEEEIVVEEEDVDVEGSEGYESAGIVDEDVNQGANGVSGSSSESEEASDDDQNEENETEEEEDLFGPNNEDYVRSSAQSRFSIPSFPPAAQVGRKDDSRPSVGRAGGWSKGGEKTPFSDAAALLTQGVLSQGPSSIFSSFKSRDLLVADMKFGPIGHQDETLQTGCPLQEPQQIACYSRTSDGEVHFDDRCLRKFQRRILGARGLDLNEGFEHFIDKKEDLESNAFGDLLSCLRASNISLENIHFVTFRNNLNKILGTTYNRRDPWEMGVHKRNGTVYLDVHKLPEGPQTDFQKRCCYWGYAFEKMATECDENIPVDANVEFCSVIRTKLGPHRIIMGAEIDCFDVGSDGRTRYTELKTSREIDSRTAERFERDKLLKFWIQSFLAGVPQIVCGFRDDGGRLVRTERMWTQEIKHQMKNKRCWEGSVCVAFADRIFCWLYGSVKEGGDYVLRFIPNANRLELWKAESCPVVIMNHVEQ